MRIDFSDASTWFEIRVTIGGKLLDLAFCRTFKGAKALAEAIGDNPELKTSVQILTKERMGDGHSSAETLETWTYRGNGRWDWEFTSSNATRKAKPQAAPTGNLLNVIA
jgi:hypothetical protein